jgi:hypothetical protein
MHSPSAEIGLGKASSVGWLQDPRVLLLICALGVLPVAVTGMPLLVDLGGHLGRFAVQTDEGASPVLRQWYSFHWGMIPNLGTDLLVQALTPRLGLEPALRLVVTAIPGLQIAGWLLLARAVHGRVPPTTLFALPLAYGYPFQFGFLNFTLGMALGTILLAAWIWLGRRHRTVLRWFLFVPLSCVLWVTHLVGWAVFAILAGCSELVAWRGRGLERRNACVAAAANLACLLAPWLVKLVAGGAHGHGATLEWFDLEAKAFYLIMPLRDRWAIWDIGSALVILGMIGWSWRSRQMTRDAGLALGAMMLTASYLAVPRLLLGSAYADMRLMPAMLAMALLAVRPGPLADRRTMAVLALAGLSFTGARLAGNTWSLALFDRTMRDDLVALDAVPTGSQLVILTIETCDPSIVPWQRERRFHLGGYAIARRHAFSNDQWVIPGGQLLQVHNPAAGSFETDPSETAHEQPCRHHPGLDTIMARIPPAMKLAWILDDGRARAFPGWHPLRFTPASVLYGRD